MCGARGALRACACGQPHRTSDALDARVKRAGQTHDNLNITLKCEDTFFVYPERVQEFLEIWFLQHYLAACTVLLMAEHIYVG